MKSIEVSRLQSLEGGLCIAPEYTPGNSSICEVCALVNYAALTNGVNFEICPLV